MNGSLIIIVALFAALWFIMIRPQRAKQQKQRELLSSVEPGDEILTVGGIYGIVQELEDEEDGDDLVVEIAEGIHVRVARRAVATVVKPDDDEDEEDEEDEEDDTGDDEADDVDDGDADAHAVATWAEDPADDGPGPRRRRHLRRARDGESTDAPDAASSPERS